MKRILFSTLIFVLLFSSCAPAPVAAPTVAASTPTALSTQPEASATPPVLLFTIGMHIEPLGETAQGYGNNKGDYHQAAFFDRHAQDILAVTQLVEAHGGRMTIQAQSPFTTASLENGGTLLADLARSGHEIALHFHEDAHLGKASEDLPVETWCAAMKEEIGYIQQASGVGDIRYWSGGNLYPGLLEAAACAGLEVNSDWKDPTTQSTPSSVMGIHPWRPAGGSQGSDVTLFAQHDPAGAVIFLPEGQFERNDFASMRRSEAAGGDEAYFEFLAESLRASLAAAEPGQVNVFHFTVHPGEFRGDPQQLFAMIEKFLAEVVDPLVAAGRVQWATFSQMADAYTAWEQAQAEMPAEIPAEATAAYMTFAINVHDWSHPGESADTLLALVDLFEKYGVRGDFYFTAPIVEAYAAERPDVIERLKNSDMTISYHIRPPHPLYTGFDDRLQGLSDDELHQTLLAYETYALDLATGDLDRSLPGGYSYVAQVFGRKPVVASAPSDNPRLKAAAQRVYAELGAQMTLMYHEEGTKIEQPFEYINGLLVRPSDFSVTRLTAINGSENFWWNAMSALDAERYNPTALLQTLLAEWESHAYGRAPFITALIHENNYYRSGAEAWSSIYFTMEKGKKSEPLPPPYDLNAPDPSTLRTEANRQAIFAAYEDLVAYAAVHLQVVTSEDIIRLAENSR